MIQEAGTNARAIESKVDELVCLPGLKLSSDELAAMSEAGDNKGWMELKGANRAHTGNPEADRWSLTPDLEAVGSRWGINPDQDLSCTQASTT
jgi:hypothetical protein